MFSVFVVHSCPFRGRSPLNFPENPLSVKYVRDENPTACCNKVLDEVFGVRLAVGHAPAEGKVVLEDFMAHVHEDGIHT